MFQIGLNPNGVAYTVGLQGVGTPRANPHPTGLSGFLGLAREIGAAYVELDHRWLMPMSDAELLRLREALCGSAPICSFWLSQDPGETLDEAIRCARGLGARLIRLHLTPVLEGARASLGPRWQQMVNHARDTLEREAPRVAAAGLTMAIENHQDFGSEELVAFAEALGDHVGIVFDTGNPFSVGEDPVAFARRAAHRIRHVHLKDYVAQFTEDGYRLIRCAIGDGAVPFPEIAGLLEARSPQLTASIEPGALEARHIRLFRNEWWSGYPSRDREEIAAMLVRLQRNALDETADYRTPWEMMADRDALLAYERAQLERSVEYLRALGWMPAGR